MSLLIVNTQSGCKPILKIHTKRRCKRLKAALITDFDIPAFKTALSGGSSKFCPGGMRVGVKRAGVNFGPGGVMATKVYKNNCALLKWKRYRVKWYLGINNLIYLLKLYNQGGSGLPIPESRYFL